MKNLLKCFNLAYVLPLVFLTYAGESSADNNSYLMFMATNYGNGYHGNLITTGNAKDISDIDLLCNNSQDKPADLSGFNRTYKAMV